MDIALVLGIIGTITGILGLLIQFLGFLVQKPQLKLVGLWLQLKKARTKYVARVAFTVHNVGDRPTQISRLGIFLATGFGGDDISRVLDAHSTIHYPQEGFDAAGDELKEISLDIPLLSDSDLVHEPQVFESKDELDILVSHTHGTLDVRFIVPAVADWDKESMIDSWYIIDSLKRVSRVRMYLTDLKDRIVHRDWDRSSL